MANASDFIGGGGGPAFTELGSSEALLNGVGWIIDPVVNTVGINLISLMASASTAGNEVRVGGDKVTITNNKLLSTRSVADVTFQNIYLPPGEGVYVDVLRSNATFDIL